MSFYTNPIEHFILDSRAGKTHNEKKVLQSHFFQEHINYGRQV